MMGKNTNISDPWGVVSSLQSVTTAGAMAELLENFCEQWGFSYYWYIYSDSLSRLRQADMISITNYPEDFAQPYIRERKYLRGPVFLAGFDGFMSPRFWDDIFTGAELSPILQDVLQWAKNRGVANGILCNLPHRIGEFALLHFAIPENALLQTSDRMAIVAMLEQVQFMIHKRCRSIFSKEPQCSTNKSRLSRRQTECLIWAARGKTASETALITGLSVYTVREHLVEATKKLSATNKIEAVAKAILSEQISPMDLIIDSPFDS